jgi:hypothetical protein
MLKRTNVESTALKSVGYDPATQKLHVEFHGTPNRKGAVAEYDDVDQVKADALMKAPSIGKFFHEHIRSKSKNHPWRYVA